ncbi:MAG TPA: hypothetical protein VGM04_07340 [Sphingomicrobium sp.]|jgi:ZIP family zinc transporter
MNPVPEQLLAIGLITGAMTFIGGSIALRSGGLVDLLLDFSSGTIIGVALFDLIPEALHLAGKGHGSLIAGAAAAGLGFYLAIDRATVTLDKREALSHIAPATLVLHSLFDGLGIGFAFHLSWAAGVIVVVGVLAHDLVDGANTIGVALAGGASSSIARRWLVVDSFAPMVGILLAGVIPIPAFPLAVILGVFGGFFLYIGGHVILSRMHAGRLHLSGTAAMLAGLGFIYAVIWAARSV